MPSFYCRISAEDIADLLSGKIFTLNADPDVLNRIEKQIRRLFFSTIDWRNKPFDIRTTWEPARLQNITTLIAYANAISRSEVLASASIWAAIFVFPLSYIFVVFFGFGPAWVWWSMNISILAQTIFLSRRYFKRRWIHISHGAVIQPAVGR